MSNVLVKDQKGAVGTTSPIAVTLQTTPVNGNLLFAAIASNRGASAARTVSSITETGVTWAQLTGCAIANGSLGVEIWMGVVAAGASTSASVAFSGTIASGAGVEIIEISGCSQTVDGAAATNTGTSVSPVTAAHSDTFANDLELICVGYASLTAPTVQPPGYAVGTFEGTSSCAIQLNWNLVDAAGSDPSVGWTIGSVAWATIIIALKDVIVDTGLTPHMVNTQPSLHYRPTIAIL